MLSIFKRWSKGSENKIDYRAPNEKLRAEALSGLTQDERDRLSVLAHSSRFLTAYEVNEALKDLKVPYTSWHSLKKLSARGLVRRRVGISDPRAGNLKPDKFAIAREALNEEKF